MLTFFDNGAFRQSPSPRSLSQCALVIHYAGFEMVFVKEALDSSTCARQGRGSLRCLSISVAVLVPQSGTCSDLPFPRVLHAKYSIVRRFSGAARTTSNDQTTCHVRCLLYLARRIQILCPELTGPSRFCSGTWEHWHDLMGFAQTCCMASMHILM